VWRTVLDGFGDIDMESPIAFLVSATVLLVVPGPTNSLIATSGAISGLRRTIFLLPAELCAYMIAIVGWGLGLGAVVRFVPAAIVAAKLAASAILVVSAWKLWTFGGPGGQNRRTGPQDIFLVTISNPKALIFALTIVPYLKGGGLRSASPYLAGLAFLILIVGAGWATIGAGLAHGLKSVVSSAGFARIGAMILLCFAVGLVSTTLRAAEL
jgi:threonine/homoserine/homoserine lactone efflux protein